MGFLTSHVAVAGPLARPPTACIDDCWVHPDHRGRGLGRSLVDAWRRAARASGCEAFEVSTLAADGDALAFWHAMGFRARRVGLALPAL